MNPSSKPDAAQEAIETAAVEWLIERGEGFKPGRAKAFAAWCAADARHAAEIANAEAGLELINEMPKVRLRLRPAAPAPGDLPAALHPARARRWLAWRVGLAALLAISVVSWWSFRETSADEALHFMTDAGDTQLVALNDGSFVDVNSNSALKVRMLPAERAVELSSGEAHFDVAPDASRPFVVKAGGVSVRAVGTAFNVRVTEQDVEVLVVEGKVEVTRTSLLPLHKSTPKAPLVSAHERVRVDRSRGDAALVVEAVDAQAVRAALSWHTQITNFSNQPLSQIVKLFNRRNLTQLVVADEELAARRIGGAFAIDRPLAFVHVLEREGDIVAERRGENEIVLRRAR
jgi:transmembrane sensor